MDTTVIGRSRSQNTENYKDHTLFRQFRQATVGGNGGTVAVLSNDGQAFTFKANAFL